MVMEPVTPKRKEIMIWADPFDPSEQKSLLEKFGKVNGTVEDKKKYYMFIDPDDLDEIKKYDWIKRTEYIMEVRKMD